VKIDQGLPPHGAAVAKQPPENGARFDGADCAKDGISRPLGRNALN
jgi:hypothetical protein